MMESDSNSKLSELTRADDYVNWNHRVKAYIQTKYDVLHLTNRRTI